MKEFIAIIATVLVLVATIWGGFCFSKQCAINEYGSEFEGETLRYVHVAELRQVIQEELIKFKEATDAD